jgi:hypothetical protein
MAGSFMVHSGEAFDVKKYVAMTIIVLYQAHKAWR